MKGKPKPAKLIAGPALPDLLKEIRDLIFAARKAAVRNINTMQVLMNYEIGRRIVKHEQSGKERAAYGKELLKALSGRLTKEFGKGFSLTNLKLMRQFYLANQKRIGQKASDRLRIDAKSQKASDQTAGDIFTLSWSHYVGLVFYNRLLRCYVLIDLKIGKLSHQNLGQMQMYVNYFYRFVKRNDENPTIGIILCRKKNDALVEITLPEDANIHASEYQLYLPSKEELKQKLLDWTKGQAAIE